MWTDVHFVLLTQYIFEAEWNDGIKILFGSAHTHALFNMMNIQEKEKFLKYCDFAAEKIPSLIKEFRFRMSFEPYHLYYIPIVANIEDLQLWENDETKEYFFRNLKFDKKAYAIMAQVNPNYINEFLTNAKSVDSDNVKRFAKRLKDYL